MLAFEQSNGVLAKSYFEKAITVDKDSYFGEESASMLQNITPENLSGAQTESGTQNIAN